MTDDATPAKVRLTDGLGASLECEHGSLRRKCELCDAREEIAELRYGLERALAQRDDEGDRLDWLMVKLAGSVTRELLGVMSHTGDPAEFRRLIDDVRGEPARCVRQLRDGRMCGLRPPCPDCGRACHDVPQGA